MIAPERPLNVEGEKVAIQLQPVLVDLVALSLNGKPAHWHVRSRHFSSVHLQLDTLVSYARDLADLIAERIVALGMATDGRAQTVASASEVFPGGFHADDKVIALIVDQLDAAIEHARETIGPLDGLDLVSQDLVLQVLQVLEKHRWMFEAQKA